MAKITLSPITGSYASVVALNARFQQIENALNDDVLWRDGFSGEPNSMSVDFDMAGNIILNAIFEEPELAASSINVVDANNFYVTTTLEDILGENASRESLVRNGDFKNGFGNWTDVSTGTGTAVLDDTTYTLRNGAKTVKLTRNAIGDVAGVESDLFNVTPNKALDIDFAYNNNGAVLLQLMDVYLDRYDDAGTFLSAVLLYSVLATDPWTYATAIATELEVGAAVQAKVRLEVSNFSGTFTDTWISKIRVDEIPDSSSIPYTEAWNPGGHVASALGLGKVDRGSWTPSLEGATVAGTGWTYSLATGSWARNGNLLYIDFDIRLTAKSVDATGSILIAGMPETFKTGSETAGTFNELYNITWNAGVYDMVLTSSTSNTKLGIFQKKNTGVGAFLTLTELQNTTILKGSIVVPRLT